MPTLSPVHLFHGYMRGRNRYSRAALVSVEHRAFGFDQPHIVRVEMRSGRPSELAPAWLEIVPQDARAIAAALIEAATVAEAATA